MVSVFLKLKLVLVRVLWSLQLAMCAVVLISCVANDKNEHTITISTLSPPTGDVVGGYRASFVGKNFKFIDEVLFNGKPCTDVSGTSTEMTCTVPVGEAAGPVDVVIKGEGKRLAEASFTYTVNTPTVVSFSPGYAATAGTTEITITGLGFGSGSEVRIGTTPCSSKTVVSETEIKCKTPAQTAGSYLVTVVNPLGNQASAGAMLQYNGAPVISTVTPTHGSVAGGTSVTITGTNFVPGTTVFFGPLPCTVTSVDSTSVPNQILCTTAPGWAASFPANIFGPDGQTAARLSSFTYSDVPVVTSVSPNGGNTLGGTTLAVSGANFNVSTQVRISGVPCTSTTYVGPTKLTCVTPPGTLGLTSVSAVNLGNVSFTLNNSFEYRPAPSLSSVSPAFGPLLGNTQLTIIGSDFVGTPQVMIDGRACLSVVRISSTELRCRTPAGSSFGLVDVEVTNPDGQKGVSSDGFEYRVNPVLFSISPAGGPPAGTNTITLYGAGFMPGATVTVRGQSCTSPNLISSTNLTCVVPAGTLGTADVALSSNGYTVTQSNAYTYRNPPTVASFFPASGPESGGNYITITGTGFVNGATARIGLTSCSDVNFISSTTLQCKVTTGTGSHQVTVENPDNQTGTSAGSYTYLSNPWISFMVGGGSPYPPNPDDYGTPNATVAHTYTVRNSGGLPTGIMNVAVNGGSVFGKTLDTCSGAPLTGGSTCIIEVTFYGSGNPSGNYSGNITVTTADGLSTTNAFLGSIP